MQQCKFSAQLHSLNTHAHTHTHAHTRTRTQRTHTHAHTRTHMHAHTHTHTRTHTHADTHAHTHNTHTHTHTHTHIHIHIHIHRSQFPSETVHVLSDHSDEVWYLKFSHDGSRLASGSRNGDIIIWNISVCSYDTHTLLIRNMGM